MSNTSEQTWSLNGGDGRGDDGDVGGAYLLVIENDLSSNFHLPRRGEVVIGRGPDVDLRLTHPSVSRRHATIRIEEGVMRIADLGSHNGTRVNGEPVREARILASGDVAMVGDVTCVVHVSQPAPPARSALGEVSWKRRLVEEVERAFRFDRSLAVIAMIAPEGTTQELAPVLRLIDVVGRSDDGQPLLLLPETDRDQARAIAGAVLAIYPRARLGVAVCPSDAIDADAILFAARNAARRASPGAFAEPAGSGTRVDLGGRSVLIADPQMTRSFALIEKLATSQVPILIRGDTGVGKENAAYAVHHFSGRPGPFVTIDCTSIPKDLAESELFGHDKGAFTGATAARVGYFEAASGGTVFLDELGELPLELQAKLLRVLETGEVTRVGETRPRPIDVRVVSATNRVMEVEIAEGRFRRDLYFRLSGATVNLPRLRDRPTEIPLIAYELLAQFCAKKGRAPMTITPAAMKCLLTYAWPGNVRELRNEIEVVVAAAPDDRVEPSDLASKITGLVELAGPPAAQVPNGDPPAPSAGTFRAISDELTELERRRMAEALEAAGGVKTRAAALISMPIRTFTMKAKKYGF